VPGEPRAFFSGEGPPSDVEPQDKEILLEQMADVVMSYRPDATDAPELFEGINLAPQAISPQNAFLIQDMMRDVVRRGTGVRARRELGRSDLSGKTGTSNDRRDAWFGGFNADMAAVVWVGYDDDQPLGPREEGSRTALPIWIEFARIVLKGAPEHQMDMPEGIVSVRIDRETGCPARVGQANVMFEVFREGHVPDCEQLEEIVDPFNNAGGIDPEPEDENEEESDESLF
jgi:penicillin-binding protein 1A